MLQKYFLRLHPGLLSSLTVMLILWLTLAPHPLPENDIPVFPHADKLVHAIMFGGLVLTLVIDCELFCHRRYQQTGKIIPPPRFMALGAAVIATLLGGFIEVMQWLMDMGRAGDWLDLLADSAGALLSAAVSPAIVRQLLERR